MPMCERSRKFDVEPDVLVQESTGVFNEKSPAVSRQLMVNLSSIMKFFVYCTMLVVPLYAITMSVIKHDWLMVIVDALIVPIGFVHGILLLTGLVV
jgi:KaiC/GvpD/RAD55 family RecA-like ATPase